jgi:pimeloyl-ACP methyl ester carboxylesterase
MRTALGRMLRDSIMLASVGLVLGGCMVRQDQPPTEDPFYFVDAETLAPGEHGRPLRHRPIATPAGLEGAGQNTLIIYKSSKDDAQGTPVAVSAILALPKGEPGPGGWPVIAWAHGTVGSADKCAPSMDKAEDPGSEPLRLHQVINRSPHPMLNAFLEAGYAVVMSDYEGLGTAGPHPYLDGVSQARSILDAVRAARQLSMGEHGQARLSTRVAIVGHSQGGQAALFAAHQQPGWTPELHLVGVAAIAPASKLELLQYLPAVAEDDAEARASMPFLVLVIQGALRAQPTLDLDRIFTTRGKSIYQQSADSLCRTELSESVWVQPGQGLFSEKILTVLDAPLRAMHPNLRIEAPIRLAQAEHDARVSVGNTRELKDQLNATNQGDTPGVPVCYEEYATVEAADDPRLGDHFGILKTDIAPMTRWLGERLRGAPPRVCGGGEQARVQRNRLRASSNSAISSSVP